MLEECYGRLDRFVEKSMECGHTKRVALQAVSKNAEVGYEWMQKFVGRHIADPGVKKVQAVADYLAKTRWLKKGYVPEEKTPAQGKRAA